MGKVDDFFTEFPELFHAVTYRNHLILHRFYELRLEGMTFNDAVSELSNTAFACGENKQFLSESQIKRILRDCRNKEKGGYKPPSQG